jgi:transposase
VATDEKPVRRVRPKSVTQAADRGTERELLVAMRSRLARSVEDPNTPARDLAALSRRLREVDKDIRAIDAAAEEEAAENAVTPDEDFDSSAI